MDLLISDVHLGAQPDAEERWKEALFEELVGRLGDSDRLLLLGDIFDVWIGWSSVLPAVYLGVGAVLRRAALRGVEIHLVVGNHDFAPGRVLERDLGMRIHEGPTRLPGRAGSVPLMIAHGDEPAAARWSYRLMRRALRWRPLVLALRLLPPDATLAVGRAWSRRGGLGRPSPAAARRWLERYRERVVRDWWRRGDRVVISGHHHYAEIVEEGEDLFINLGHWLDGATWAEIEDAALTLWHQPFEGERRARGRVGVGEGS